MLRVSFLLHMSPLPLHLAGLVVVLTRTSGGVSV